ncbi:MAG: PilZ domain-containing protein [Myxococcales bacterium]|nr:PilZ domain-containing protein [Myxococcales bacterium]
MASLPQPQRAFPRHAIDAEIALSSGGQVVARGRTRNLSRGGLCAVVGSDVSRGAVVDVAISLVFSADGVSEPLTLSARVVWCTGFTDAAQIGLSFLALDQTQAGYLDLFIRFLTEADPDQDESADSPFDR